MYGWFLASVADSMEVMPGAEFNAAFLAATRLTEGQPTFDAEGQPCGAMGADEAQARTRDVHFAVGCHAL